MSRRESRCVLVRGVGAGALIAAGAIPAAAQITVTSSQVDLFTNGTAGRLGSTTGLITDDPPPLTGTVGTLFQSVGVGGGPVLPGDLPTLPGTTCQFTTGYTGELVVMAGTDFLLVNGSLGGSVALIAMDGPGLSASVNASGALEVRFALSSSAPYRLRGFSAIDDQDVSGGVRLFRGLLPLNSFMFPQLGTFHFSGTATASTYRLLINSSLTAIAGTPDVGDVGNFSEFSDMQVELFVGCLGALGQPGDRTVCQGRTASFTFSVMGAEEPQLQWEYQDSAGWHDVQDGPLVVEDFLVGNAAGANTETLHIVTAPFTGGTVVPLRCRAEIPCGEKNSLPAILTVEDCCPADVTGSSDPNSSSYGDPDGDVDAEDFFYYLDQFGASNFLQSDLTGSSDPNDPSYGIHDGLIDASDFFYYLDIFALGCP